MHKISTPVSSCKKLTQAVLQVTSLLGMYQAELARILGLQCSDIADMAAAKKIIETGTQAERQARLFVDFYNLVYDYFQGDEVGMCNWFRRNNNAFSNTPFYLIVDDNRLEDVVSFLQSGHID